MNQAQWKLFSDFRESFKQQIGLWQQDKELMVRLQKLQKEAADADKVPDYPMETPVVYNRNLDLVMPETELKAIIVGDNPGKDEQLLVNNKYLVGLSGKVANTWFSRHPELGIDFRANTIILNKTPVHTAKTKELKTIAKQDAAVAALISESTAWMAEKTCQLHADLCKAAGSNGCIPKLWLVGYGELSQKGVFATYADALSAFYTSSPDGIQWADQVGVFQHFSMNRFFIDVEANSEPGQSLEQNVTATGVLHRKEILKF